MKYLSRRVFCLATFSYSFVALAQDKVSPKDKVRSKLRVLVESLASKNPPLKLEDRRATEPIPDDYDWSEQVRVWLVIQQLIEQVEDAWPELVAHLDDNRHCVTISDCLFGSGEKNWTVGNVCRILASRTLAQVYYKQIKPESADVYRKMRTPRFTVDLKKWCEDRSMKALYELQIETCEWACKELEDDEKFPRIPQDSRREWISDIRSAAKTLSTTHRAVAFAGFGREEFIPYSKPREVDQSDPFAE